MTLLLVMWSTGLVAQCYENLELSHTAGQDTVQWSLSVDTCSWILTASNDRFQTFWASDSLSYLTVSLDDVNYDVYEPSKPGKKGLKRPTRTSLDCPNDYFDTFEAFFLTNAKKSQDLKSSAVTVRPLERQIRSEYELMPTDGSVKYPNWRYIMNIVWIGNEPCSTLWVQVMSNSEDPDSLERLVDDLENGLITK